MKITKLLTILIAGIAVMVMATTAPVFASLYDNLVAYWRMDEESGNTAYDFTDYHNDGTINGASPITGRFGGGFNFVSTESDYIIVADSASLQIDGDMSIAAWIKPNFASQSNPGIVVKRDGGSLDYAFYYQDDNERLLFHDVKYSLCPGQN